MQFDTTKPLRDLRGGALKDGAGEMTLGSLAASVLVALLDDTKIAREEKGRRFVLATRIAAAEGVFEISSDDVTLLKRLVDTAYPAPLVSGQFSVLIDPPADTAAAGAGDQAVNGATAH